MGTVLMTVCQPYWILGNIIRWNLCNIGSIIIKLLLTIFS